MREILFRGKRKDNGEWVYGDLLNVGVDYDYAIRTYGGREHGQVNAVNENTVGQYTGLPDKNGKKIFEGDLLKHYYDNTDKSMFDIGVMLFDDKVCQFKRNSRVNTRYYNIHFECEYEVIGNIHDNPELLKGEEENA